jgi:predicted RNA-binding Zn ribbon-like protein
VNFDSYADASVALAVDLVNSGGPGREEQLTGVTALQDLLREHCATSIRVTREEEVAEVHALRERLRAVFVAAEGEDGEPAAAALINELLAESGTRPQLSAHDGEPWHLHYTPDDAPVVERVAAEAAMALAAVAASDGFGRLRRCQATDCEDAFVDTSRNRSRKYCTTDCANRTNVAAWRARQRSS